MNNKDSSEFRQEPEKDETKEGEGQFKNNQDSTEGVKDYGKSTRSCSFVRNWGGWIIAGE